MLWRIFVSVYRPLKWWLKWVQRWNPSEHSEASTLGTAWHVVMAHHYGTLQDEAYADVHGNAYDALNFYNNEEFFDRLFWMYEGYREYWAEADLLWEIIEFESTQTVEIMPGVLYEWTTDLLVFDKQLRKLRVVDAKSTKNPLRKIDTDLSDQLGLYIKAQTLRGKPVADGITNQARTEKLKRHMTFEERYARIPTYRSPIELDNIWYDAQRTIKAMLRIQDEGEAPYSAPDPRVCSWKCDFVEAHLVLRKTHRDKWDSRLGPLMRTKGLVQKDVPRGSDDVKVLP